MGTAVLLAVAGLAGPAAGSANGGAVIIVLKNQHDTGQFAALNASREGVVHADQNGVLAAVRAQGGTNVRQLVSVNAIAANLSPGAVAALRANPAVAEIQPDEGVSILGVPQAAAGAKAISPKICPADPAKPLLEPEALTVTHTDQAWATATGKGVTVAIDGMNDLAGNPNLIRPDGSHVVVGSPTPNADNGNDESFGDASVVAAQGVVTYDYSRELPFSGLPAGCTFRIKGLAPDASLVDANGSDFASSHTELESQLIAGIDNAVVNLHANVLSQSFGFDQPGGVNLFYAADDAAVKAGVTVAASSGDSGSSGTVILPASDPNVIAVGATDTLRLRAQADGYADWVSNNMAALSSGGPAANDKVVDLVAPGDSSAVSCNPATAKDSGCPDNTLTETFRGTSMSAPIVAGAAADVIQAYADAHGGAKPSPALVKQILTGTATDLGAPSDQQGAGLLNTEAAVRAATGSAGLIPSPSQVDITGNGGSSKTTNVSLYNASGTPTTVTGRFRELSAPSQIGPTVTENITAPAPG
ncbi:MAG TPA: S8 family serine peptidase, partial [Pseudonocardiaceae bacterium]|nr:S8 family serine peptidase [Pseudonocardiaceae bacterium]